MAGNSERQPRTLLDELLRRRDTATYRTVVGEFLQTAKRLKVDVTMSERHLTRIAAGESGAGAETRRVLEEMFSHSSSKLLDPWTNGAPHCDGDTPSLMPAKSERDQIMDAARRAKTFTMSRDAGLASETLDQVTGDLAQLVVSYQVRPLGEILPDLVELQDCIFGLVEAKRLPPQQARQLYLLGGITTGLLAKASHDLAEPHAAMTQARAAQLCAEQADHDGLRAWLNGIQALVAYWAGRHQSAIRYAQQGAVYADRVGGTTAVWLPMAEARSWAAMGDEDEAVSAIDRAARARDNAVGDELDELGGLCTFGAVRQTYYAADALTWLPNQAERAERYSQEAVNIYGRRDQDYAFGDNAGASTDLAIARINRAQPDLEGASEALASVLALPPSQRINGVMHSMRRVNDVIGRSSVAREPKAQNIVESIDAFTALSAASVHKR